MQRRKLKNLNLLDDFLFGAITDHPVWGEPFSRILLETIFQRKFGRLKVLPQKTYPGKDTDLHGARLDVYLEEIPEEAAMCQASVYDMEPNQKNEDLQELSRRTRLYHALIDADCLKSGTDYKLLKNVLVLFIMPYDPFGKGRMVYTVRSMCVEEPSLPYDDGARTLFLYTRGTEGNPPKELQELLRYMENSVKANAVNGNLKQIHQIVEAVKQNREVELSYMKSWEWEQEIRKEASEAGHAEGLAQGLAEGRAEERLNTEREKQRVALLEMELEKLREELQKYKGKDV